MYEQILVILFHIIIMEGAVCTLLAIALAVVALAGKVLYMVKRIKTVVNWYYSYCKNVDAFERIMNEGIKVINNATD